MIRRLLTLILCAAAASGAFAKDYPLTHQESDSVAHALATILGSQVKNIRAKANLLSNPEYISGLDDAFTRYMADDARYQGLEEGILIAQRIGQVQQVGGFKIDTPKFLSVLKKAQKGKKTGFTEQSAHDYLNDLMARIALLPDSVDTNLTTQQSDSVVNALATIWGRYIADKEKKDGIEVNKQYMQGLEEALKKSVDQTPFFYGMEEGVMMGKHLRQVESVGGFKINTSKFVSVLKRDFKDRRTGFTPQTAQSYLNRLLGRIAHEHMLVEDSPKFLEETAKKEGVTKTPSGLLFEIITEGEGNDMPLPADEVLVNYVGYLIDGKEFNRSEENGSAFKIADLIPGFAEGLTMMKRGGTYRIYIPAQIGYGDDGVPGLIPGGAATYFDIQLLDFRHLDENGRIIPDPQQNPAQQN